MSRTNLSENLASSPQLDIADIAAVKLAGFRSIICNRPDGEAPNQPRFSEIAAEAGRLGLETKYVPIVPGGMTEDDVTAFKSAVEALPKPVLAYCASGRRVAAVAQAAGLARGGETVAASVPQLQASRSSTNYEIVIVGGGAGGIAVAASMLARAKDLDIAIIEPAEEHYYQPGWTMVGAGIFTPEETRRTTASVMPRAVKWIKGAVATFEPDEKSVTLEDGAKVFYKKLVVAPGLKLCVNPLLTTVGDTKSQTRAAPLY
jgi:sulfide:quinone oxidoreductase